MQLLQTSILLALAAALPFGVAHPTAEADVFDGSVNATDLEARAPKWEANFWKSSSDCSGRAESYNDGAKGGCHNIGFDPSSFQFFSRDNWIMVLHKEKGCKGDPYEQGTNIDPKCQTPIFLGKFVSFRMKKA